jgi:hypothetical protein
MAVTEYLKDQLPRLAEGRYSLQRLTDLTRDRLETAWDEMTPEEVCELDAWLGNRVRATEGEARLKWGFVRDVFDTVREVCGNA